MLWPDLYALSEMNYYEGRRTKSKAMLLASALYAYAVLFPAGDAEAPRSRSGGMPCTAALDAHGTSPWAEESTRAATSNR